MWFLNGSQVSSTGGLDNISTTWTVVATADFNGDGKGDILWRDAGGNLAMWLMNGAQASSSAGIGNVPTSWSIVGTGDYNGDGMSDLLWRDTSGNIAMWLMKRPADRIVGGSRQRTRRMVGRRRGPPPAKLA